MERYEDKKRGWWLDIEGAAELSMQELITAINNIQEGWPLIKDVVKDSHFSDRHGVEFALDFENPDGWLKLSSKQRHWVQAQVRQAALDEVASGEA
jgi:hypothetical protein